MAGGSKEHRMLFDLRGRRKNAVKVVYAILAVLMGLSLFLVTGAGSLTNLFNGSGGGGGEAAKASQEQAERIERKLLKSPEDPNLLASLARTRVSAGNASLSADLETGEGTPSVETRQEYARASEAWSEYLDATKEPSGGVAQLVAPALYALAQLSPSSSEIVTNMQAAADAQQIVIEDRENASTLSRYAIYKTFAFDYGAAQQAARKAEKLAATKFERENFENELEESTKTAKAFQKQLAANAKANKGAGKEAIEKPQLPNFGTGLLGE
jgi:hypothetical protein